MSEQDRNESPTWPTVALQAFGLFTLSVAQPLFDVLGDGAEFFVAHDAGPLLILLFALGPALLLALASGLLYALVTRLRAGSGLALYGLLVGALSTPLFLMAGRGISDAAALPITLAVAGAVVTGLLALKRRGFRLFLTLLSLMSLVAPLRFLLFSPVSSLFGTTSVEKVLEEVPTLDVRTPVVLLVFDELPLASLLGTDGALHPLRFPNFTALAREAHWFRDATTVAGATGDAVPALLSGRFPDRRRLPVARQHPRNLFTLLAPSHDLHVRESLTDLCPDRLCSDGEEPRIAHRLAALLVDSGIVYLHAVLPRGLVEGLPPVTGTWGDFARRDVELGSLAAVAEAVRDSDVPAIVSDFLEGISAYPPTTLHYLHLQLPHIPWRYLPSGQEYGPIRSNFAHGVGQDTRWVLDEWEITQALQRHLLQLGYADEILGLLVSRLRELGLYDRALLVVTADHGLSFLPGEPGREPTPANLFDIMSVPLFVRLPGQESGRLHDRNVELIDLLPTVRDLLGFQGLAWPMDGVSVFAEGETERDHKRLVVGGEVVLEVGTDAWSAQLEVAAKHADRVGDGGWEELFRVGPLPEIVGRRVTELESGPPSGVGIAVEQPWLFEDVHPDGAFLPAHLLGRVLRPDAPAAGAGEPLVLAVALNGVVRATTRTFEQGRSTRFTALLPPSHFAAGFNRVEVYLADPLADPPRLLPVRDLSGPGYRLLTRGDRPVGIEATNGTSCTVTPGAVEGELERRDNALYGWASREEEEERPFLVLMVFIGDRFVHADRTGSPPPEELTGDGAPPRSTGGFRFRLPPSLLSEISEEAPLRVFAVAGELCSELSVRATAGG